MRAMILDAPGRPLHSVELPRPTPSPDQVLVRIGAAGVNPVDTYIRSGMYARKQELPYTPGTDAAGTSQIHWTRIGCPPSGRRARPCDSCPAPARRVIVARQTPFSAS